LIDPRPFIREFEDAPVKEALAARGFYLFEKRLEADQCADLRERIDALSLAEETEVNYAGSEHRVWHASARDDAFAPIEEISNAAMPVLYGRPSKAFNVLAIRNRPAPPEAERAQVRWHIDSFRKQLKLFAFLTDVGEANGPLEYVPGTQKPAFKYANAIRLGYYTLRDLKRANRGKRSWQRIHDETIGKVATMGYPAHPFTVPAGTLALVDTSALHRARPCLTGERYAVTTYHH
jgi:hypothetical protein